MIQSLACYQRKIWRRADSVQSNGSYYPYFLDVFPHVFSHNLGDDDKKGCSPRRNGKEMHGFL